MTVKTFRPDHRVTVRRWEDDTLLPEIDISGDVLSVQTSKPYGRAAGGWVVACVWSLDRLAIAPHDILRIELDAGDGRGLQVLMVGLVTRAATVIEVDQAGQPRRVVRLTGLDLGKMLHVHHVGGDLALLDKHFGDEQTERLRRSLAFSGTPGQLVRSLVDVFFFGEVPWTKNWIVLELTTDDTWQTLDYSLLTLQGGSLWGTLKQVANEPWNCLTTETFADGKLHVILERTPLDADGRLTRPSSHLVTDDEVKTCDLGVDDSERINWHFLEPQLPIFDPNNSALALLMAKQGLLQYDEGSIRRHGFRPSEQKTVFTPWADLRPLEDANPLFTPELSTPVNDLDMVRGRSACMFGWHQRNHTYRNGTVVVRGRPEIRAGDGVILVRDGYQYLVESVSHNYTWGGTYSTSLTMTRGQRHEG